MARSLLKRPERIVKTELDAVAQEATVISDQDAESDGDSRVPMGNSSRHGRSDAPAPSEPVSEPGLMLREIRARDSGPQLSAAAASPTNLDSSFFQTSFQDIGKKLKQCNDTLGELQQLGVSHDVQLPELVLVGDQSAGKSSLMSGLAYLELPRSEGTCTRCPLHIRVSGHSEWSCRVRLRKDYSYQPPPDHDIQESDVTDQDPFYPWRKRPSTLVFEFKTVHDKTEIEAVLRWAQIAILNDEKHPGIFVPGSGSATMDTTLERAAEDISAKFSPNIVALEIKGPDLPDLSFYDMPGIFENPADAGDDYLVSVVRNLTKAYMSHKTALILCCMPMNSDAENSSTFALTRRLQASSRTIGVLTKADLVANGSHEQWLSIMRGEAHRTGLGYFITSRPQGRTLAELTDWEKKIFEDNASDSWPESFGPFVDSCGVERLKDFLSKRLGAEFFKSLPKIKSKVKLKLDKIHKQLANLPELPENVELEVQTGLMAFADSSRATMEDLMGHFSELPERFRDCLLEIKPKFTLKDRSDIPVLEISDDDSDATSAANSHATQTPKRPAHHSFVTPSKRARANGTNNGTPMSNGHIKPEETPGIITAPPRAKRKAMLPEPFHIFNGGGRGFRTLRGVREGMRARTKAGMPGQFSQEVYDDLVREAVSPWNGPMMVFLAESMKLLQTKLDATLSKSMERLKKRFVYTEARKHVHKFIEEHRQTTAEELSRLHDVEKERLMTFNTDAFESYKADERMILTRFRHHMRMEAASLPTKTMGPWSELTEEKRVEDQKRREGELAKLGPDQFERELEVIAYVRGYYRLAAFRFADAVTQRILCQTMPAIRRQLPGYLEEKLGLRGPDSIGVYQMLMDEDKSTATRREELKAERNKFVKALASIELLETDASHEEDEEDESTQLLSPATAYADADMAEA